MVYSEQGKTNIGMPKPSALIQNVNDEQLSKIALDIEKRLKSAIDKSI